MDWTNDTLVSIWLCVTIDELNRQRSGELDAENEHGVACYDYVLKNCRDMLDAVVS